MIFLAKALSPATMPNIKDMSEGEVAALLAGAAFRQTGGGSTYIVPDDLNAVSVGTPGGGRGIFMLHPSLDAQCIAVSRRLPSAFSRGSRRALCRVPRFRPMGLHRGWTRWRRRSAPWGVSTTLRLIDFVGLLAACN